VRRVRIQIAESSPPALARIQDGLVFFVFFVFLFFFLTFFVFFLFFLLVVFVFLFLFVLFWFFVVFGVFFVGFVFCFVDPAWCKATRSNDCTRLNRASPLAHPAGRRSRVWADVLFSLGVSRLGR